MDLHTPEHSTNLLRTQEETVEQGTFTSVTGTAQAAPSTLIPEAGRASEYQQTSSVDDVLALDPKRETGRLADMFGLSGAVILGGAAYTVTYAFVAGEAWYYHILPDYVSVGSPQYVGLAAVFFTFLALMFVVTNPLLLLGLFMLSQAAKALRLHVSSEETKQFAFTLGLSAYLWQAYFMYSVFNLNSIPNRRFTISTIIFALIPPAFWAVCRWRRWHCLAEVLSLFKRASIRLYVMLLVTLFVATLDFWAGGQASAEKRRYNLVGDETSCGSNCYAILWTMNDIVIEEKVNKARKCVGPQSVTMKLEGEHSRLESRYNDQIGHLSFCEKP